MLGADLNVLAVVKIAVTRKIIDKESNESNSSI